MTVSPESGSVPPDPALVAPADASVVNGREVTFVWEPVDEALSYRLQVAPTARFDELVLDEDVGTETAVTVGNQFPTGGETFFWRVRAVSDAGWSKGAGVESFVAATAEESTDDDLEEEQPVTGLARTSQPEEPRPVVTFSDRFEQEKERGVAYEGMSVRQVLSAALSIVVVIAIAVVVIFNWYGQVSQATQDAASGPQNYERLQQADREAEKQLQGYGIVDEEEGIYHIPIDEAMDLTANKDYGQSASSTEDSGAGGP